MTSDLLQAVTIRPAYADDALPLMRLAALDSAPVPAAPVLLAECDGELRAALSLHDGAAVADPFHPTAALVELLRARAAHGPRMRIAAAPGLRRLRLA